MRRISAAGFLLLVTTATLAAAPPIPAIDVQRSGLDLVISWTAPATPVDGYRVYVSNDLDCATSALLYAGSATNHTVAGGLAQNATQAIYRIVSYVGPDEGPPAGPVYKYEVIAPSAWPGPVADGITAAVPRNSAFTNAQAVCLDVNGAPGRQAPLRSVVRWMSTSSTPFTKFCSSSLNGFLPAWPEALVFQSAVPFTPTVIWGHGHGDETIRLALAREVVPGIPPDPDQTRNLYVISLPYDHAYDDLAAVAADLPTAVDVRHFTGEPGVYGEGLTRPSSADPWVGTNYPLSTRRGEGILVAVDAPTTWIPRRLCTGPTRFKPFAIRSATMVRRGTDIELRWTPDALALGGYSVYRVFDDPALLPDVLSQTPAITVPAQSPVFPIVDTGAVSLPGLLFYQIVGRAGDGSPGDL